MSVLKFLVRMFSKSPPLEEKQAAQNEPKDLRTAQCPYCHANLKKIPGRKTKCPHCGNFMYVRSKPDNTRVVVTQGEAEKIDEEWALVQGMHDQFVAEKQEITAERDLLRKRFGREPSDEDVRWSILNKSLVQHAKQRDWGLYRNARFEMGECLRKENKLPSALATYLEVCYIDLNGPNNTGGYTEIPVKEFDPKGGAFLAPGILSRIEQALKRLEFGQAEVKEIFLKHNQQVQISLKLPLSTELGWKKLCMELYPSSHSP